MMNSTQRHDDIPVGFSQIPGNPTFRTAAVNAVAIVPLLVVDSTNSDSAKSFTSLFQHLARQAQQNRDEQGEINEATKDEDILLVVPNSSLTRPGDWRYNETPLKSFHWHHGSQRIAFFDGRPQHSRNAHDRLLHPTVTRDWIDLVPSRRTAAVIGVLNVHDCTSLNDLHRAEEELHQWATRYATPRYQMTAHGQGDGQRDQPVERLFVFDSFDETCQNIDLSQSRMGSQLLAFPPSDEAHSQMMQMHLNVVVNDLAVAIFRELESKIQESDHINRESEPTATARSKLSRFISGGSNDKETEEPVKPSMALSLSNMASLVNPNSKLAQESPNKDRPATSVTESDKSTLTQPITSKVSYTAPQFLTPLDPVFVPSQLSHKDADAMRRRAMARRCKHTADLALLAGSPLDAYERYLKAAELCKTNTPDPLWYGIALEGCAAAHIAMAEAGGYMVDEYLENNFQLPDDIMALAKKDPKDENKRQTTTTKQTLPEIVFALCEEALNIFNRHSKLAPFQAELLMKLAHYSSENAEGHLRCRWGEGDGCFRGDADKPRWEKPSVYQLKLGDMKTKDGESDMISINTFNRMKRFCELLQQAVAIKDLDSPTRLDVALSSLMFCLKGFQATKWKEVSIKRIPLPRKAAYFATVAAETISSISTVNAQTRIEAWHLASKLYSTEPNDDKAFGNYGWATLRASLLHALSLQGNTLLNYEAAQKLMRLLGDISTETDNPGDDGSDPLDVSQNSHRERSQEDPNQESEPVDLSSAPTFATKIRESFSTMTTNSSILSVQSKWADDEPRQPLSLPLGEPSDLATLIIALSAVWSGMSNERCSRAQKRCIDRIAVLRRALPTSAAVDEEYPGSTELPLFVSSATAIKVEATLALDCIKRLDSPKKDLGAMATFYNPFANKKKSDGTTRVAEEEERALLIEFDNKLSVPIYVNRCQLEFDRDVTGRIEATALSFTLPAKAKRFTVHFPFTTLPRPLNEEIDYDHEIFEVTGINLTCLGRSVFLPFDIKSSRMHPSMKGEGTPPPGSLYKFKPEPKALTEAGETSQVCPKLESFPCQPRLQILYAVNGAPIEVDSTVDMFLTEGEISTLPLFRLQNYAGPSGRGQVERLQVLLIGVYGQSDLLLYDSDSSATTSAHNDEFEVPFVAEKGMPFRTRVLNEHFKLDAVNMNSQARDSTIEVQVASSLNFGNRVSPDLTVALRIRYRGSVTSAMEAWRSRDIAVRLTYFKGPCVSSIDFRPDINAASLYTILNDVLQARDKKAGVDEDRNGQTVESGRELDLMQVANLSRSYICSPDTVFLVTLKNPTKFDVEITSLRGALGGFKNHEIWRLRVGAGESITIPIEMTRFNRLGNDGKQIDLVFELSSHLCFFWERICEDSDHCPSKGHIRTSDEQLQGIFQRYPMIVSHLCEAPCSLELNVTEKNSDLPLTTIGPGAFIDISGSVQVASWVPDATAELCRITLEFVCARLDNGFRRLSSDHVWIGKLRQSFAMKDERKDHQARIAFTESGKYGISMCARITRSDSPAEEIWWAPVAKTITVDENLLVAQ